MNSNVDSGAIGLLSGDFVDVNHVLLTIGSNNLAHVPFVVATNYLKMKSV